jgi:hypothetical protein
MRHGPGEYLAGRIEGITRVEDLPPPSQAQRSRNYRRRCCPRCHRSCYRHAVGRRTVHDLGCSSGDRPKVLQVTYSRHDGAACDLHVSVPMADRAPPGSHGTQRVLALAVRLGIEDGLPYRGASWHLGRDHRVFVPFATIRNWVAAAGKKGRATS